MALPEDRSSPINTKSTFFGTQQSTTLEQNPVKKKQLHDVTAKAQEIGYGHTSPELKALESEVDTLTAIFRDNKQAFTKEDKRIMEIDASQSDDGSTVNMDVDDPAPAKAKHKQNEEQLKSVAFMLYYFASVLQTHYEAYVNKEKLIKYQTIIAEINSHLDGEDEDNLDVQRQLSFLIQKDAVTVGEETLAAITRTSKLRSTLDIINMQRIYWIFSHFVISAIQTLALQTHLQLKELDTLCDAFNNYNFSYVMNIISVALFSVRLLIDLAMIAKHVFSSKENDLTRWSRFKFEANKRKYNIANNLVWGSVNFLTNFRDIPGFSELFTNQLIAYLLVFDVALLQLKHLSARKEYKKNRLRLLSEHHQAIKDNDPEREQLIAHQIKALKDQWEITNDTYWFDTVAAALLLVSFAITLAAIPPAGVVACYLVGTLAVAMYLSEKDFKTYREAKQKWTAACQSDSGVSTADTLQLENEYKQARNALIKSVIEKTVMPTIILLTFAANIPAGAALLAIYMLFKIVKHYHEKKQTPKSSPEVNRYNLFQTAPGVEITTNEKKHINAFEKEEITSEAPLSENLLGLPGQK